MNISCEHYGETIERKKAIFTFTKGTKTLTDREKVILGITEEVVDSPPVKVVVSLCTSCLLALSERLSALNSAAADPSKYTVVALIDA